MMITLDERTPTADESTADTPVAVQPTVAYEITALSAALNILSDWVDGELETGTLDDLDPALVLIAELDKVKTQIDGLAKQLAAIRNQVENHTINGWVRKAVRWRREPHEIPGGRGIATYKEKVDTSVVESRVAETLAPWMRVNTNGEIDIPVSNDEAATMFLRAVSFLNKWAPSVQQLKAALIEEDEIRNLFVQHRKGTYSIVVEPVKKHAPQRRKPVPNA